MNFLFSAWTVGLFLAIPILLIILVIDAIMTTFSAKNVFNATIKYTAFGIVDYSSNSVMLIGIE